MNQVKEVLSKWLQSTWNDTYIMYSTAFDEGFRIVDHSIPSVHHQFYVLLCNLFPAMQTGVCPYSKGEDFITFFPDGVQVTIKPFDDEIHHTRYVKEENPNGESN